MSSCHSSTMDAWHHMPAMPICTLLPCFNQPLWSVLWNSLVFPVSQRISLMVGKVGLLLLFRSILFEALCRQNSRRSWTAAIFTPSHTVQACNQSRPQSTFGCHFVGSKNVLLSLAEKLGISKVTWSWHELTYYHNCCNTMRTDRSVFHCRCSLNPTEKPKWQIMELWRLRAKNKVTIQVTAAILLVYALLA